MGRGVWVKEGIDYSIQKVTENLKDFREKVIPATSQNLMYIPEENTDWTASFWLGMLFLSKELTGSTTFDPTIEQQMNSFYRRLEENIELETHDIGFLYILSAMADYKVNHHESSKRLAVRAADALMSRYNEKTGIIQAWGNLNDSNESGRIIIDCLMNLPLLYFASEVTGDERYAVAAKRHAHNTQKYIVRSNATTYHTYFFDISKGEALRGETAQGYAHDSCWARGQAWGIYGFTLSYQYTGDYRFIETACRLADYFIDHLPKDKICYWDLDFIEPSSEERDSSAAAIAACGLLELSKELPVTEDRREKYERIAIEMMKSLTENYLTQGQVSNGILLHGVYDKNHQKGVDECMSWGDYFYMEGLIRLNQVWYKFW